MTDRPILFSAPMVQSLIAGRKTQTRRIINKQAAHDAIAVFGPKFLTLPGNRDLLPVGVIPGDRLYVREAWRTWRSADELPPRDLIPHDGRPLWYEADPFELRTGLDVGRYRHARFMPRWASRLTLTVTDVRVQRLQDISEADATDKGADT
jgi:hypothetical protein